MTGGEQPSQGSAEELIRREIITAGGWLSFENFMQLALHAPGSGYYACGHNRIGPSGDFITAPETGPLFATCLAEFITACLPPDGQILEIGPGTGTMAAGILTALQANNTPELDYLLLETSAALSEAQQEHLRSVGLDSHCSWITTLPTDFRGVIIGNEVLDVQPCQVLVRRGEQWLQRGVGLDEHESLTWQDGAAAAPDDCARLQEFAELPEGYCLEINRYAEALVASLVDTLAQGALLLLDYGFARPELYHPQRSGGTLMAHLQHTSSMDVLAIPGDRDITAHVDFTAMAEAGVAAGAELGGFTTQANFLLDLGITDKAQAASGDDEIKQLKLSQQLQQLLLPHEMGELFKVLALQRGVPNTIPGFALRSRQL